MPSLFDTWREFARYLRRPVLLQPAGIKAPGSTRIWSDLLVLQVIGLFALVPALEWWRQRTGISPPEAFGQIPPWLMVPGVVLAAPVLEECLFRGWLTGRPRALWLALCILAVGALLISPLVKAMPLVTASAILVVLVAALVGWIVMRKRREPPVWFAGLFPMAFYGSVVLFAVPHISNYAQPGLATLPMVLPQLWAGLVLGYLRLRVSLPASIAAHACSNGLMLALAVVG